MRVALSLCSSEQAWFYSLRLGYLGSEDTLLEGIPGRPRSLCFLALRAPDWLAGVAHHPACPWRLVHMDRP
jgi:hypothetical protein